MSTKQLLEKIFSEIARVETLVAEQNARISILEAQLAEVDPALELVDTKLTAITGTLTSS